MKIKVKLSREENISYYGKDEIEIDIEEYLLGVIPSEIGNAHIEACKAQAVASRTYAINVCSSSGYITDKSGTHQAFRTSRFEGYPNAAQAVRDTVGESLYYNNKQAKCYYSASNGGQTTSSKERWGGDYAYLISQKDEYDFGPKNGHGVGLSQQGAKNRAAQGQNYREILNFYFPGTYIQKEVNNMPTPSEQKIIDWCLARNKAPYVYGGLGQTCTPANRQVQANQYKEYADLIKKHCQRMSGSSNNCGGCPWLNPDTKKVQSFYDCQGFVKQAMKQVGLKLKSGATSQFKDKSWQRKSGPISEMPKDRVCVVYRDDKGIKQHTGIWLGEEYGFCCDARGHASGVKQPTLAEYKWTHYVLPKLPDNNLPTNQPTEQEVFTVLYKATVTASSGSSVNMRSSASKGASKIAMVPIGTVVDVLEEGTEWCKIVYENKTGFMMKEFLVKKEEVKNEYYVKIKCASASEAKRLVELLGAAIAE